MAVGVVLAAALGTVAMAEWERGRECAHYNSRDLSTPRCDGWSGVDADSCLRLCQNSSLPDGCSRPDRFVCEFAVWSVSATWGGWCQSANASCAPIDSGPETQLYHISRPPVNATCDLAHYEECADTLEQHGEDCAQAGGGQPDDVRRCLDFFFGGNNVTEYCCPCVLFYAQKYRLPTLKPACTDDPAPGPAPPPTPPWGPCTSMAGQWRNVGPGTTDVYSLAQDSGACNWLATGSQDWSSAAGVWVSQWDIIATFEYATHNVTFKGHLNGCNPQSCPSGSTIDFASSSGETGRWAKA